MSDDPHVALRARLEASRVEVTTERDSVLARSRAFMTARMLLFLGVVVGFFGTAATGDDHWAAFLMLPTLAAFIATVFLHAPVKRELARLTRLRDLIAGKLERLDSEQRLVSADPDLEDPRGGSLRPAEVEAEPLDPAVLDDLAVFSGRAHLMGLIDTSHTRLATLRLADWLRHPSLDVDEIRSRRDAARSLAEAEHLRHEIEQVAGELSGLPSREAVDFLRAAELELESCPKRPILFLLSGLIVAAIAAALVFESLGAMIGALLFAGVVNLALGPALQRVPELRGGIAAWQSHLAALPRIVALLDAESPGDERIDRLRERIAAGADEAAELRRGLAALSLYRAGLFYVIFAWLTLYDLLVLAPLLSHLRARRGALVSALDAMAELEALVCLGTLAVEQRHYCWPEVEAGGAFEIEGGLHPYLPSTSGVPNSIQLEDKEPVAVVTGSNMTGKSTFLKMCGLNQLLASIGAPARAAKMRTRPLIIHSDINVRDSLDDGRSYFAVEVERIKTVLDDVAAGRSVLAILDEMFRGTNTAEKVAAGCEVVRWLAKRGCLSLIATHDAPFTRLEDENIGIRNYHFAETIKEDRMVFDHRLKSGPARTRNAIRVLEIAGYPEDLVARALERSKDHD